MIQLESTHSRRITTESHLKIKHVIVTEIRYFSVLYRSQPHRIYRTRISVQLYMNQYIPPPSNANF